MNNAVLLAVLALVALAIVAYPLLRRGRGAPAGPPQRRGSRQEANAPDESAFEAEEESPAALALREISLDFEMGRLSEADYRALRERYERELAEREMAVSAPPAAPPAVSRAPRAPRAREMDPAAGDLDARAEAMIAKYRGQATACPSCGVRPEPDATFCSSCGRRLAPCPGCGRALEEPDARFCPSCGTPLAG